MARARPARNGATAIDARVQFVQCFFHATNCQQKKNPAKNVGCKIHGTFAGKNLTLSFIVDVANRTVIFALVEVELGIDAATAAPHPFLQAILVTKL